MYRTESQTGYEFKSKRWFRWNSKRSIPKHPLKNKTLIKNFVSYFQRGEMIVDNVYRFGTSNSTRSPKSVCRVNEFFSMFVDSPLHLINVQKRKGKYPCVVFIFTAFKSILVSSWMRLASNRNYLTGWLNAHLHPFDETFSQVLLVISMKY